MLLRLSTTPLQSITLPLTKQPQSKPMLPQLSIIPMHTSTLLPQLNLQLKSELQKLKSTQLQSRKLRLNLKKNPMIKPQKI